MGVVPCGYLKFEHKVELRAKTLKHMRSQLCALTTCATVKKPCDIVLTQT